MGLSPSSCSRKTEFSASTNSRARSVSARPPSTTEFGKTSFRGQSGWADQARRRWAGDSLTSWSGWLRENPPRGVPWRWAPRPQPHRRLYRHLAPRGPVSPQRRHTAPRSSSPAFSHGTPACGRHKATNHRTLTPSGQPRRAVARKRHKPVTIVPIGVRLHATPPVPVTGPPSAHGPETGGRNLRGWPHTRSREATRAAVTGLWLRQPTGAAQPASLQQPQSSEHPPPARAPGAGSH